MSDAQRTIEQRVNRAMREAAQQRSNPNPTVLAQDLMVLADEVLRLRSVLSGICERGRSPLAEEALGL